MLSCENRHARSQTPVSYLGTPSPWSIPQSEGKRSSHAEGPPSKAAPRKSPWNCISLTPDVPQATVQTWTVLRLQSNSESRDTRLCRQGRGHSGWLLQALSLPTDYSIWRQLQTSFIHCQIMTLINEDAKLCVNWIPWMFNKLCDITSKLLSS